jgi:hypothetical protein
MNINTHTIISFLEENGKNNIDVNNLIASYKNGVANDKFLSKIFNAFILNVDFDYIQTIQQEWSGMKNYDISCSEETYTQPARIESCSDGNS